MGILSEKSKAPPDINLVGAFVCNKSKLLHCKDVYNF